MTARARRSPAKPATPAPARDDAPAPAPPAPPLGRDPWALAVLLGILPLLVRCWGAPLGEPVAEDFDFLHRSLFHGLGSLLDGGGSQAFWRPLAHQGYYALLGRLVLDAPLAVGALSAALLALGALLLYRVFRAGMSGPVAAIAASFPLMAESTRTLVGWPTQFVDLGMFLFSALALHEFSRRRLPTALAALLAALLCKEVSIVACVLLPLLPVAIPRRERIRAALGVALVTALWGALYLHVRHSAHLELPHGLERDAAQASALARLRWSLAASLRAVLSLDRVPGAHDLAAFGAALALLAAAAAGFATSRGARAALAARRAWLAWGLAWFLLASAALTPIYPLWQPNRSQVGSVGLGAALAPALASVHPALAGGLVVLRLALLALAPGAATSTSIQPPETGAFMDFAHLTRLQHFMRLVRATLHARHPTLPPHAAVVMVEMPHGLLYAFGGDNAVQDWYADSTLHTLTYEAFARSPETPAACVLVYQADHVPELVELPVEAFREQVLGLAALGQGRGPEALAHLARADSLAPDPEPARFHAGNAGLAAYAYESADRWDEALREGERAHALDPRNRNAWLVLTSEYTRRGRLRDAGVLVDSLEVGNPGDPRIADMRRAIEEQRGRTPGR